MRVRDALIFLLIIAASPALAGPLQIPLEHGVLRLKGPTSDTDPPAGALGRWTMNFQAAWLVRGRQDLYWLTFLADSPATFPHRVYVRTPQGEVRDSLAFSFSPLPRMEPLVRGEDWYGRSEKVQLYGRTWTPILVGFPRGDWMRSEITGIRIGR